MPAEARAPNCSEYVPEPGDEIGELKAVCGQPNMDSELDALKVAMDADASTSTTKAAEALATSLPVQADRVLSQAAAAAVAAQSPVTNAAAAAASALAAAGYATLAQATNPDAPVRLNPRRITTALNIASGYNAESVGPITIAEGITVTVSDNATWSVN